MYRFFRSGCAVAILTMACAAVLIGQTASEKKPEAARAIPGTTASSPAYAELLLKRTELSAELEALVFEYTEEFPKVKEIRHALTLIDRESGRLAKVKAADASRLTLALGKLIVRKIEFEIDLWNLRKNYLDEHPEVKRAKRKVEIYETAINEILK